MDMALADVRTCAFCGLEGDGMIPASLQPGTDLYRCADKKACLERIYEASDAAAARLGLA